MPAIRPQRRARSLLASALVLGTMLAAAPASPLVQLAAAASYATPSGLTATKSAHAVGLRWKAVPGVTAYRVQFSTKSRMSSYKTIDVVGTHVDWMYLNPEPKTGAARLKASTNYYFRVKAISLGQATLSHYSKIYKVKTAASSALPELAPIDLRSSSQSSTSEYLSWSSRGPGVKYEVRFGTSPDLSSGAHFTTFDVAGGVLEGLTSGQVYRYKVRVVSTTGAPMSAYSAIASFTTRASDGSPAIKIATYNICSYSCSNWSGRMVDIRESVGKQAPDVIALQEAGSGHAAELTDAVNDKFGSSYRLVSGYSNSTKLAYSSERFADGESGVLLLPIGTSDDQKYAVWTVLTDRRSGKKMFVVGTHLRVGDSWWELRQAQTEAIVQLVKDKNTGDLPVIVAGDFNSGKNYDPSNIVYDVLSAAGYSEPMGNPDGSWAISRTATAEHRIDLEYNTVNAFERLARRSKYPNGYDVDYIWHSRDIRVAVSQVVVRLDTNRKFIGTIPSDHNMLTAIIHLP